MMGAGVSPEARLQQAHVTTRPAARVNGHAPPDAAPAAAIPQRALRLLTLAECAAAEPRGYLVKGMMAPGDLVVLFGPPGAGKSVLGPFLAHAVAAGRQVFGRRTRQGPVLYIAAEDGAGMKLRAAALREAHGDAPTMLIVAEPVDLMGDGNEAAPPDLAAIIAAADHIGAVLIVLDTMARAFPGLDENDSRSMGRAVKLIRGLCSPSRAVLLIHHGAKEGGTTPRGHGCLDGDADVTLRIEAKDGGAVRAVKFGKNRNGVSSEGFAFTIRGHQLGIDDDGDPITSPVAKEEGESGGAEADPKRKQEARLNDAQALLLRQLRDLCADATPSKPYGEGPAVQTIERSKLISALADAGWFRDGEIRPSVLHPKNGHHPVERCGQTRLANALNGLKRKGFVGFDRAAVWPL